MTHLSVHCASAAFDLFIVSRVFFLYALECAIHRFVIVCAIRDTTKCGLCIAHNQTHNANSRKIPFYSWINRTSLHPPYLFVHLFTHIRSHFLGVFCSLFYLHEQRKSNTNYAYIISAWIASGKSSIYYIYHIYTKRTRARCQSIYCFRTFWQIGWMGKVAFVVKIRNEVLWNNCVIITHSVVGSLALLSSPPPSHGL